MPTLKTKYQEEVAPALMSKFGYKSPMQIPRLDKIIVNVGCSEARENAKVLDAVVADLGRMAGEGDARARETFATVGGILAAALRDLLVEHGVECLLLGGQISRSFAYMEAALRDGLRDVAGLTRIAPAEHIGEAAFYGLLAQADGGC